MPPTIYSSHSRPNVCALPSNMRATEFLACNLAVPRTEGNLPAKSSLPSRIIFKSRGRILFLPIAEIRWIGAEENYIRVCTGSESHLLRETMTSIESKLDSKMFMRVHRSAIVNLRYVKEVRKEMSGDFCVLLSNGHRVAMSRSHHSNIDHLLTRL